MRLLATIGAVLFSGIISATPLHNIVIFGDSLSDNGNLYEFMKKQMPQSPPYYKGRFSNGPVWIEHVIASYFPENPDAHLLDYAFGGAGVSEEEGSEDVLFTLRREVNNYLLAHYEQASGDSLFVVWVGANNYLGLPAEADKVVQEVNLGIVHSLQRLADKGAKHILVVNLPDLGRTPAAIEFETEKEMTYMTEEHNKLLIQSIAQLKQSYPDVEWLHYDLHQAFEEVIKNAIHYGFTNITNTCVQFNEDIAKTSVLKMVRAAQPLSKKDVCTGYLFFDLVHPTGLAHQILAEKAREMLDQQGIQFSN